MCGILARPAEESSRPIPTRARQPPAVPPEDFRGGNELGFEALLKGDSKAFAKMEHVVEKRLRSQVRRAPEARDCVGDKFAASRLVLMEKVKQPVGPSSVSSSIATNKVCPP